MSYLTSPLRIAFLCEIPDFRRDVVEICPPHRAVNAVLLGSSLQTFRDDHFFHLHEWGSPNLFEPWKSGPTKLSRESQETSTDMRCIKTQDSEGLCFVSSESKTKNFFIFLSCNITTNAQLFHKLPHSYFFSTLSSHPQGVCNQYLAKLHRYFKCISW
jgi:hypothetical protein